MIDETGCCSCHLNAPCGYCSSHSNCEKCDAVVDNDYMIEVEGCWLCENCQDQEKIALQDQEKIALDALAEAWNSFVLLESTHPDDLPDFRRAIHECQRIIAVRQLRRIDPTWVTHRRRSDDQHQSR